MKNIILVVTILLLTSCNNKIIDKFNSKKEFYQNLQQSKKIDKKAVVTYLHNKQHLKHKSNKIEKAKGERFIVGIFDGEMDTHIITLNSIKPAKITALKSSELKDIPLQNSWSSYYLVEFKYINSNRLKFQFDDSIVKFYKGAKYLIVK